MTEPRAYRKGDLVRYADHDYVVSATNREGKVRLIRAREGAPAVRALVAPSRVELLSPAPRIAYRSPPDPAKMQAIGAKLRAIRLDSGWTTRRLADAIGMSQTYLTTAELGKLVSPPSPLYLKRFAEVTGADEDDLCATAGVIPVDIVAALRNVETLRSVRLLIEKLEGTKP
jgi:transcriptional regulator with XRE-family HTH domain